MKTFLTFIVVTVLNIAAFSQSSVKWFPSELNIQPFKANFIEPRTGFAQFLSEKKIRLDIGTSDDIVHFKNGNRMFSIGMDFATYTRLHEEPNFRFPVDAVDYLFGLNAGYRITEDNIQYGFRFRLGHISAHFADGHFNETSNNWIDELTPFVYSREFLELFPFYEIHRFRVYLGLTYLFHVIPSYIGRGIFQAGFDYHLAPICGTMITPFIGYDFKLMDIRKYSGSNIISLGIKFGNYNSRGISLVFSYLSGKSVHGEYFYQNEHYATIGINYDL